MGDVASTGLGEAPAGWYADPHGLADFRYWDGMTWTSTVSGQREQVSAGERRRQKGAELEAGVARYLQSMGYSVRKNVILTGQSGAQHEIDVLAERNDAVSTTRIAVECKAWETPIEKDVVAKLSYVLGDLGIRDGIVACTSGFRTGAEAAARQLGIRLWGPGELTQQLGSVALQDIRTSAPQHLARGVPFGVTEAVAQALIAKEAKGRLGIGGETIVWTAPAWIPVSVVQLALSSVEGRLKKVMQTRRAWNTYELVGGTFLAAYESRPSVADVDLATSAIRPQQKEREPKRSIEEALKRYNSVSTEAARARHLGTLQTLGVPTGFSVTPESCELAFFPAFVSIARRRDAERIIVVDGARGVVDYRLSNSLSRNIHWVRESLRG